MTVAAVPAIPAEFVGESIDDASTTAQVKFALQWKRPDTALHTTVLTEDGIVGLGGIARNEAEKVLFTKLATDINGVKKVINDMTIAVPRAAN